MQYTRRSIKIKPTRTSSTRIGKASAPIRQNPSNRIRKNAKTGGGKKASSDFNIPFLGNVPIDPEVVITGDSGEPFVIKNAKSHTAKAFADIAKNIEKIVNKK